MKYTIQLFVLIVGILFSGCKIYKKGYIDEYDDFEAYSDKDGCQIFKKLKCADDYKHYNPKKCINIQYAFSSKDYKDLRILYNKVAGYIGGYGEYYRGGSGKRWRGIRKKVKNNNCVYLDIASNDSTELVNSRMYGLYQISSNASTFFFFLRTENGLYFSYCKDALDYYTDALNESGQIEEPLKKEIINFINTRCKPGEKGIFWFEGDFF